MSIDENLNKIEEKVFELEKKLWEASTELYPAIISSCPTSATEPLLSTSDYFELFKKYGDKEAEGNGKYDYINKELDRISNLVDFVSLCAKYLLLDQEAGIREFGINDTYLDKAIQTNKELGKANQNLLQINRKLGRSNLHLRRKLNNKED